MWLRSWLNRFAAGRKHGRWAPVSPCSGRGRPARLLSVERLEDRLTPNAGALDATFNAGGTVTTDFADAGIDLGFAVALQADGKIVVVGATGSGGSGSNFAVARYLADGALDTSFSGDGKTATDIAGGYDEARAVAIQADGKIVVAGYAVADSVEFALARYKPDGTLDTTFGTNGKVTTDFFGDDEARGVAIQADGKIVVVGRSHAGGSSAFALARYLADGTLDPSFSGDGKVTTDFGSSVGDDDAAVGVAIRADGKIVVAGFAEIDGLSDFALARYNSDGTPDTSFSGDGKTTTDFAGGRDEAHGVALQADGKIVVAGMAGSNAFGLARYNPDGSLDSDFDADGKVTTNFGGDFHGATSMVIQPGGRIVVAGTTDGRPHGFLLARYNNLDGALDTSFGTNGSVTTYFSGIDVSATSMALQADGKIVVAGFVEFHDFALARYDGGAPEIAVVFAGADLSSGSTVAFGTTQQGTPVSKTFTIRNLGDLNLTVSSITVPAGYRLTGFSSPPFAIGPGSQVSITVQIAASTAGVFNGQVSIRTNDSDENPFRINVTATVLVGPPEIQVLTGTTDVPHNTGVVNVGTHLLGSTVTRTFTVQNIGNGNLTLGPGITVPSGFILASGFGSTTVAPGDSTTFALGLNTSIRGTFSGQVSFATNDSNENPFNFTVTGAVASGIALPMIRGESLTRYVDEGGVATLRGHLVDSDPLDELFLRIDWGDGMDSETHAVGRAPFAFAHRYLDDPGGPAADDYPVHFTWFDSGGSSNSKTLPVAVANVAPRVSVGLPVLLRAGDTLSRVGSFTDPGLDSWYATVDYGDGPGPQWLPLGTDNRFTLDHRYAEPGVYEVRVRIFDDDGGVATSTVHVTVRNAPPQPFLGGAEVVGAGAVMRHGGYFTDPFSATRRATVDYGDGCGPQPLLILPGRQLSFEHRYTMPGTYRVTVSLLDDEGVLVTDWFRVTVL